MDLMRVQREYADAMAALQMDHVRRTGENIRKLEKLERKYNLLDEGNE